MKSHTLRQSGILLLAAVIWGMAFVSQMKGMDYMGPLTFNGVRSFIGTMVLCLYLLISRNCTHTKPQPIPWRIALPGGLVCGAALTLATTLQQYGISYTTVGKSGFITTLYILFVPILGIFIKRKIRNIVWVAAALAVVGMYLLCMEQDVISINMGDVLTFFCAIVFAVHILVIDHYSPKVDGAVLSAIQFLVCGVICTTGAFFTEQPSWAQLQEGVWPLLYAGVMCCGVAYTLQIVGQKGLNPTIAALVMSLEAVVAAVAGFFAYRIGILQQDQTLTVRQMLGCAIVFGAVILVQLPTKSR
ncbi:MAG: DMT family transporter [Lachnospiraceae bacterium]|jgi:drug/metabolite transporter (DMT)-like permease|nr:DMT family transporter [Lachnospiraceae bacterium]